MSHSYSSLNKVKELPQILSSNKLQCTSERNIIEEKKVKILSSNDSFSFNLNIYGSSILTNLFLLVSTNASNNTELVYKWKRIKDSTSILLKEVKGRMYILSAEDIGYTIDVEVMLKQTPNEIAKAQYGPLILDKELKNTLCLLLSQESPSFTVNSYVNEDKPRSNNAIKSLVLSYHSNEFLLNEIDNSNKKEKEAERCKYILLNTIITLNQFDPLRFSMLFYTYEYEDTNSSTIKLKSQREYDLMASSKQARELIYLLFKFRSIEEELKHNKMASFVNFSNEPKENSIDLIEELRLTKEDNKLMTGNIKYLEYINNKLTKNLKRLEEDYELTLETFNALDVNVVNESSYKREEPKEITSEGMIPSIVLKNKNQKLFEENMALIERDREKEEEIKQYIFKADQLIKLINTKEEEIAVIKEQYTELKNENAQLIEANSRLLIEVEKMRTNLEQENESNQHNKESEKKEYALVKNKLLEVLTDKNAIERENNTLKQEKAGLDVELTNQIEQVKALRITIQSKDLIVYQMSSELNSIKSDNSHLQRELLQIKEASNLQQLTFNEKEQNRSLQLTQLENQRNALRKKIEEIENESKAKSNDCCLLKASIKTKEDELKAVSSKLDLAFHENKAITKQYESIHQDYIQLQELYDKMNTRPDLNYSQDSFIDVKRSEMLEELNQLKREKDETDAYILKLKYNNDKQLAEIQTLKQILSQSKLS